MKNRNLNNDRGGETMINYYKGNLDFLSEFLKNSDRRAFRGRELDVFPFLDWKQRTILLQIISKRNITSEHSIVDINSCRCAIL